MAAELLNRDPVFLVHLHALHHKEARFDGNGLLQGDFVPTVVDFGDEVIHLKAVERGDAVEHLEEHHAQRPSVHLRTVAPLFQQLGTLVKRGATDAEACISGVEDCGEAEVRDFDMEFHSF